MCKRAGGEKGFFDGEIGLKMRRWTVGKTVPKNSLRKVK
jgi:hypothetical protein